MDISFHYYAVKAIAVICGFNEPDAQLIATYSQFVDDFKTDKKLNLDNIPPYCEMLKTKDGKFQTVQTGFGYLEAVNPDIQTNVIMPYHFIPEFIFNTDQYETSPALYLSNCLIDHLLELAVNDCIQNIGDSEYLVSLGLMIHTFADTYAHADFNAFDSDANKGKILASIDSNGRSRSHVLPPFLPPIGHAHASTAPDESDLNFTFDFTVKGRKITRENWSYFASCAVEIGKYFCDVLGVYWSNELENRIKNAINVGCQFQLMKDTNAMQSHWKSVDIACNNIPFHYELPLQNMLTIDEATLPIGITKTDVFKVLENNDQENSELQELAQKIDFSTLKAEASKEFYKYNYTAYILRETVLGRNREERR